MDTSQQPENYEVQPQPRAVFSSWTRCYKLIDCRFYTFCLNLITRLKHPKSPFKAAYNFTCCHCPRFKDPDPGNGRERLLCYSNLEHCKPQDPGVFLDLAEFQDLVSCHDFNDLTQF